MANKGSWKDRVFFGVMFAGIVGLGSWAATRDQQRNIVVSSPEHDAYIVEMAEGCMEEGFTSIRDEKRRAAACIEFARDIDRLHPEARPNRKSP